MNWKIPYSEIRPGILLISEPYSSDPYFKRSVVLITSHSEEGTTGLIVNKQLTIDLSDLIEDFPARRLYPFLGGPVRPSSVSYLHRLPPDLLPGSMSLGSGYYLGGPFDRLKSLFEKEQIFSRDVRFCLGMSGWTPQLLKNELENGFWGVSDLARLDLCTPPHELWYQMVESSDTFSHWALIPENPESN